MSVNKICSPLKINSFKYEWTIEKFRLQERLYPVVPEGTPIVKSPFFFLDDNHIQWYLGWYFYEYKLLPKKVYEVSLSGESQEKGQYLQKKMEIECTISYDNEKKQNVERKTSHSKIYYNYPAQLCCIPAQSLEYIKNSHEDITIICHFHIVDDFFMSAPNNPVSDIIKRNLSIDIVELFNNKKFTDVTFILGDKQIQAHKTILMARSPVFAAMFSHLMKEQNDNEIKIDDIDYEVLEEMLRYIYTDDVSDLKCPVTKLLYTAEKYGLKDLKETCGELLQKEITIDNAAETFIIADRYNLTQLSARTQFFIHLHFQDFLNSSDYESMVEKYPKLAIKVFKLPTTKA